MKKKPFMNILVLHWCVFGIFFSSFHGFFLFSQERINFNISLYILFEHGKNNASVDFKAFTYENVCVCVSTLWTTEI